MFDASRPLTNNKEIEPFVKNILRIADQAEKRNAISKIGEAERNCSFYKKASTLHNADNRDVEYQSAEQREYLWKKILSELKEKTRLEHDDEIELGLGGAKPLTDIQSNSQLFYVIGLPASGKSGISNVIADYYGAYILDSDYAKRKLPEFSENGGASLVHEESDEIVFNNKEDNLLLFCLENHYNIVVPKIGHNKNSICEFCEKLYNVGYSVNLISVDLDRNLATKRAYNRFIETQRYVPLSLIFDVYSNQPSLNYFKIKQKNPCFISGYAQLSTEVPLGYKPILLEEQNLQEFNEIFNSKKERGEENGSQIKTFTK